MRVLFYIFIFVLIGCKEPEPRRPVTTKTGTFFKESAARNQKIRALEEVAIKKSIATDSLNTYYTSADGFWYCYEARDTLNNYTPQKNDVVLVAYTIKTLENTPIYTKEQIGIVQFKIDGEMAFPGLNTGLKLMKKGETVHFLFPSYLAYGYHGDGDKIGVNIPLKSTVSLIDIIEIANDRSPN